MTTATEKYIQKAVKEAKKEFGGNEISNCNITMNVQADGATETLARAMLAQAEANEATSDALNQLAKTLKPIDICAIKVTNEGIDI